MSNYMAIATVTAALSQILLDPLKAAVGSSATVEFKRPDGKDTDKDPHPHVNVYLYQVTPNAAFRNVDLPTRRSDGTLVKQPVAALDLHYLFTFHGKDELLEPQRMLGVVARVLQSQPILSAQNIQSAISTYSFLLGSDLGSQMERVRFTPATLTLEEFSKLWSAFFQVEYRLSVAYQASVVLIESEDATQEALPVQSSNVYVATFRQPTITQVISQAGANQPILPNSTLVIQGTKLLGELTSVKFGNTLVTPTVVTDKAIILPVPNGLPAGVQGLQVVQQWLMGTPPVPHPGVESNIFPLVLHPVIVPTTATSTNIKVTVSPAVMPNQRVTLLLNQVTIPAFGPPAAYSFVLPPVATSSTSLSFTVNLPATGTKYFIRLSVDGAESPLDLNPGSSTFGPTVKI